MAADAPPDKDAAAAVKAAGASAGAVTSIKRRSKAMQEDEAEAHAKSHRRMDTGREGPEGLTVQVMKGDFEGVSSGANGIPDLAAAPPPSHRAMCARRSQKATSPGRV